MFSSSQIVKDDINFRLTGLASSVLREKMIVSILSDKFPSPQHCNMYSADTRAQAEGDTADGESCDNIFLIDQNRAFSLVLTSSLLRF